MTLAASGEHSRLTVVALRGARDRDTTLLNMSKETRHYDITSRMSQVVTAHPQLLMVMQRLGIALGLGDRSIDEVCRQSYVDTAFFMLLLDVVTSEDYVPPLQRTLTTDMSLLVPYLRASHAYYVNLRLPHIEQHLHNIARQLPSRMASVFNSFFDDYKREVAEHFAHEEQMVYPHVEALQRGERDQSYRIDTFIANHGNLQDKLDDLLQIIFRYLPPTVTADDDLLEAVFDILQISSDLSKHSLIEERVLVPYVSHLEATVKQ